MEGEAFYRVEYRSACCQAGVRVVGKTTQYHVCRSCSKPCDVVPVELTPLEDAVVDILEGESGYRIRASPIRASGDGRLGP